MQDHLNLMTQLTLILVTSQDAVKRIQKFRQICYNLSHRPEVFISIAIDSNVREGIPFYVSFL